MFLTCIIIIWLIGAIGAIVSYIHAPKVDNDNNILKHKENV